jgi:hypothetical protein
MGRTGNYVINKDTLDYLEQVNVRSYFPSYVLLCIGSKFTTRAEWEWFLRERNITQETEIRFLTEAALYASVIANFMNSCIKSHLFLSYIYYYNKINN